MTFRTSVSTGSYTHVHTATHIADVILGSIADILGQLGLHTTHLFAHWETDQSAISAWIAEESLKCVTLECHQPDGVVDPIFEFPVSYGISGSGDRNFTADRAALAQYLAKLREVPYGTTYRLFCSFEGQHTSQPGWSPGSRASTDGMFLSSFGTLATAPHAGAALRYYRK